jgi:hypothetical protein
MGSTICIKCGSSLAPFSYCELCKEPLNFKCSSCGFVTEEKVHVDCASANFLVKEDKGIDKADDSSSSSRITAESPKKQDTILSDKAAQTDKIKVIEESISEGKDYYHYEHYPLRTFSDIVGKSLSNFEKLNLDIVSFSSRLSSLYYEQFLHYKKVWSSYWTETFKSFNTIYHRRDEQPT